MRLFIMKRERFVPKVKVSFGWSQDRRTYGIGLGLWGKSYHLSQDMPPVKGPSFYWEFPKMRGFRD